jgi:serine/threonine protein kinase
MTLTPDTKLGNYEIIAPLGAGGIGEVYRAGDSRLGCDVAIKVPPKAFTEDLDPEGNVR